MKELLYGLWILSLVIGVAVYEIIPTYMVGFVFGMVSIKILELAQSWKSR